MAKQNKENDLARKQLRQLKEKYGLTWPQVAEVFGRSGRIVQDWAGGQRNIPTPYQTLIRIYITKPLFFKEKIPKNK